MTIQYVCMTASAILARLEALGLRKGDLADALGISSDKVSKSFTEQWPIATRIAPPQNKMCEYRFFALALFAIIAHNPSIANRHGGKHDQLQRRTRSCA